MAIVSTSRLADFPVFEVGLDALIDKGSLGIGVTELLIGCRRHAIVVVNTSVDEFDFKDQQLGIVCRRADGAGVYGEALHKP